jgi:hypothetical protein
MCDAGTLATWLAKLSLEDVPEAVRERAKYLLPLNQK